LTEFVTQTERSPYCDKPNEQHEHLRSYN
jgi:hypothetical protein